MKLAKELKYYNSIKKRLLPTKRGKFALIKGEELIDIFSTSEEAYEVGIRKFGVKPFLIVKITDKEEVESIPALSIGNLHAHL